MDTRHGNQKKSNAQQRKPIVQSKNRDLGDSHQCPICLDIIIDAKDGQKGQDSVFCEGVCNGWIHRRCAGLSSAAFAVISSDSHPFYCPNCRLDRQNQEIADLKAKIQKLTESVQIIKKNLPAPACIQAGASYAAVTAASVPTSPTSPPTTIHGDQHPRPDRKFNLVIFGIKESPKGTKRHVRSADDIKAASSILSSVNPEISEFSIRDCYRLGKYSEDRHRPVLATMNRVNDVSSVLANRRQLSSLPNISIKPDMSPQDRKVESILLKQRRDLISSGTDARSIKLRKNTLYVNGRKYGMVTNFKFIPCPNHFSSEATSSECPTASSPISTSTLQSSLQINTSSDPSPQVATSDSQNR